MKNYKKITAKSGLISFGNTGARLSDPRTVYARILRALTEFRKETVGWEIQDQKDFGNLLGKLNIFDIETCNTISSDKDVRVKTAFISQLGFTDKYRTVTNVGKELLKNTTQPAINEFEISADSFTYLKQFLKYQHPDFQLIPLLSLIYAIIDFDNKLPIDFVTYIWADTHTKNELLQNIKNYKKYNDYRKTIFRSIEISENTKIAKENIKLFFKTYKFSNKKELKQLFYFLLPHGKGKSFVEKPINLFYDFYSYWQNKMAWSKKEKINYIKTILKPRYKDILSKKPSYYLENLFGTKFLNNSSDWNTIISFFENTTLISSKNEKDLILNFHIFYMMIKKMSLCEEYRDLNIRHLKLLDIFIFDYDTINIDIVFLYLFRTVKDNLIDEKPLEKEEYIEKLERTQDKISDIYEFLDISIDQLTEQISTDFPDIKSLGLKNFALRKKEERFLKLIDSVFTKENIITIFKNIYPRNDKKTREFIKDLYQEYDASIPALFEYLLGISFYWISEKQIKISDILSDNLDANLLPKTHTAGGQADIVIKCNNKDYLIEATLSESNGQRQMESEPVPRHLAKHILETNPNSLALFVAGKFDLNNLVVLRNYKFSPWYSTNEDKVDEMDILPLSVENMIFILQKNVKFSTLEHQFYKLLNSQNKDGFEWYKNEVNIAFSYANE